MPQKVQNEPAPRRYLPVLLTLFIASGCSALIYEVVWYQLLQLVIGSSAISLGVLLATFMGGLCIGSLGLPRILKGSEHPLRVYAALELGIGICGILALIGMPLVDRLYAAIALHGLPGILLRAIVCAVCLLPPTILMGASLPAAARWLENTREGVSWLGLFYGGNTAGAVFGCLLAGFYLLRVYDLSTATFVAAAINGAVALVSYNLSKRSQATAVAKQVSPVAPPIAGSWPIYAAIALSGASALGAEVVWTRLLGLLLGATVYTFSIILAVFLVGLGLGSTAASLLARRMMRPKLALGICQFLLCAAVGWTAFMLARSVPYWPINPLLSRNAWLTFQVDLVRCIWTILPATILWGASFPFALAAVTAPGEDAARTVGGVYAANTGGAILGAVAFSMLLIPWIGTTECESVLIVLALVSALLVITPLLWPFRSMTAGLGLACATSVAIWLVLTVAPVPPELIAYGRRIMTSSGRSRILYVGEGMNSSIAISQWDDGAVQFHVSGKVEASTEPYDMRLQRMLGHLPALVHPNPQSVLVVGFGAGVTAGSFTLYPNMKRLVVCEMEPLVPPIATQYFGRENYYVLNDPRTQVFFDDARHYVLTTPEKFDIITSDPIHPWVKGSATLYSQEYFELVKKHLNPGGVVTQWVPLYESDAATVRSEIATFFSVFPNGSVWGNENEGGGYDIVLLGQSDGTVIDVDALAQRMSQPEYREVSGSLYQVGFKSLIGLLGTYAGQASDMQPWLADAIINRDGNLRLQYMAGMALNYSREALIYAQMLEHRKFPETLFKGSPQSLETLRAVLTAPAK